MKAIEELESSISTVCNMLARDDSPPRNEIAALLRKNFTDAREELEAHKEVVEAAKELKSSLYHYGAATTLPDNIITLCDEFEVALEKLNNDKTTNK